MPAPSSIVRPLTVDRASAIRRNHSSYRARRSGRAIQLRSCSRSAATSETSVVTTAEALFAISRPYPRPSSGGADNAPGVTTTLVPMREGESDATNASLPLVAVAVGCLLVLPSIVWIALDEAVWPWDQAWYAEVSLDLWSALRHDRGTWGASMLDAFGSKPPAVAWLGQFFVPLGRLVGVERALLASVVACQIGSIALVFAAARRLGAGAAASLAGTLVLAASPLFVWATHEYFAEPLQTLVVAWSLLLLVLASRSRDPIRIAVQIPGLVALAFLAKLSSPLYIGLPLAATLVLIIRRPGADGHRLRASLRPWWVVVASAVLVLGAALWYGRNLDTALDHARIASADTGLYGSERPLGSELREWSRRLFDAVFLWVTGIGVGLVVVTSLVWKLAKDRARPSVDTVIGGVCVAGIVVVLIAFATQPNEEARFLIPLIPVIALGVVLGLSNAPPIFALGAAAILSVQLVLVTMQSFGASPIDRFTHDRLRAPERDPAMRYELERLVDATCVPASAGRISIVGAEHAWFNANTLQMIASSRHSSTTRKFYYTSLGYAENDPSQAWRRTLELDPPFYIAIDYGSSDNVLPRRFRSEATKINAFNRVNRAVLQRVRTSSGFEVLRGRRGGFVVFVRKDPRR